MKKKKGSIEVQHCRISSNNPFKDVLDSQQGRRAFWRLTTMSLDRPRAQDIAKIQALLDHL